MTQQVTTQSRTRLKALDAGQTISRTHRAPCTSGTINSRPGAVRGLRLYACLVSAVLMAGSSCIRAGLLLTEVHYNGPASGTDPDEFIELTNTLDNALSLEGYRFDSGISFSFGAGSVLGAGESLVIARDAQAFETVFPDLTAQLFDFSGALSNTGERLSLVGSDGRSLWSVTYGDEGDWPQSADGGGDSLQLLPGALDLAAPASWIAGPPNPGVWAGAAPPPAGPAYEVAAPQPAALLLNGALLLLLGQLRQRSWSFVTRTRRIPFTSRRALGKLASLIKQQIASVRVQRQETDSITQCQSISSPGSQFSMRH